MVVLTILHYGAPRQEALSITKVVLASCGRMIALQG
jgi:hypothetical protein